MQHGHGVEMGVVIDLYEIRRTGNEIKRRFQKTLTAVEVTPLFLSEHGPRAQNCDG